MKRISARATPDEIQRIKDAANAPLIALQTGMPPSARQVAHDVALAHGLPEILGYYGIDLHSGEFLAADSITADALAQIRAIGYVVKDE